MASRVASRATTPMHRSSLDGRVLLVLGLALSGGLFFALSQVRSVVEGPGLAAAQSPQEIARAVLGQSARVATTADFQTVSVHYDISGWSLTRSLIRSSFQSNVIHLVPVMFARAPQTERIEVVADNIFDTIQGREVRQPALSVVFTRPTAAKVPWPSVSNGEIARMADKAWVSPTIGWQ